MTLMGAITTLNAHLYVAASNVSSVIYARAGMGLVQNDINPDPMGICEGNLGGRGGKLVTSEGFLNYIDITGLYYVMKKNGLMIGTIICLGILISMLFVKKADILADKKQDLQHKFVIIFTIIALPTIMGWVYSFARMFG